MRFKAKKVYGFSKETNCPFCGKIATLKSAGGLDVCRSHLTSTLEEIKCTCGSWLEQRVGTFGPYFNCINCGNINFKKGLEIKEITTAALKIVRPESGTRIVQKMEPVASVKKERKEITISSRDLDYL